MKGRTLLITLFALVNAPESPAINTCGLPECKIIKACEFDAPPGLVIFDSLLPAPAFQPEKLLSGSQEIKTVVIDPGHGGHDSGCLGANSKEKHLTLAIGSFLEQVLRQNYPGLQVVMTRSKDVFIPLHERAAIATRTKADLFISIHCNFIPKADHIHGTETYVLGLHATEANLEVAKRENASILLEDNYQETYGYDPNSPEAHILMSMFQNAFLEKSILFAEKVQKQANKHTQRKDRGVKQAGFLVLRHATMPSVLVETGYLSNRGDEAYLRTEKGQRAMANALLEAFADFKCEVEGTQRPALSLLELYPGADGINALAAATDDNPQVRKVSAGSDAEETPLIPAYAREGDTLPAEKNNSSPAKAVKIINSSPENDKEKKENPTRETSEIQYRVQLAASREPLVINAGKWTKVEYLIEVIQEDSYYKYQVCNFASPEQARAALAQLRPLGFPDAFLVAYRNGQRVK
jgi:N-acetylmuramoyl-L-alanine amidase